MRINRRPRKAGVRRRGVRFPPATFAGIAVFLIAFSALGQATNNPSGNAPENGGAAVAAQPDGSGGTSPVESPNPVKTVWNLFWAGGKVMWILAACSVLAVAIIFERLYSLRRSRVIPPRFIEGLKGVYRDPREDRERALAYCQQHDSPIARMVMAFVKRLPRGFEQAEKALEDAGGNEALKLRQNMRFFYAIGSVSTLLGLIGTIAGMIKAFMVTAKAGNADNKVELLSTGIYEAMVCTFGGLAVAVVVTLFYYYFIGRIERLIGDINDELTRFSDEYGLNAESDAELGVTAGMDTLR
jgi:biopolymer transport protein ExbB